MRKICQIFFMLLFVSFIGQMRAQQTVNIGETPWKFSKVIRQESNLVSGLTVLSGTDVVSGINDGKFDTGAGKPLVGKNYFAPFRSVAPDGNSEHSHPLTIPRRAERPFRPVPKNEPFFEIFRPVL